MTIQDDRPSAHLQRLKLASLDRAESDPLLRELFADDVRACVGDDLARDLGPAGLLAILSGGAELFADYERIEFDPRENWHLQAFTGFLIWATHWVLRDHPRKMRAIESDEAPHALSVASSLIDRSADPMEWTWTLRRMRQAAQIAPPHSRIAAMHAACFGIVLVAYLAREVRRAADLRSPSRSRDDIGRVRDWPFPPRTVFADEV